MKCPYCGKTEICKGEYPEGCFLEHEKLKINHKALLNELAVRGNFIFPKNEKEETWFNEGTDAQKCPNLLRQIMDATDDMG